MASLTIDGRQYDIPEKLTAGELTLFKRHAGVLIGGLDDAMNQGDPEVYMVWCLIVKRRAGETTSWDDMQNVTDIEFQDDETPAEETSDAIPPASPEERPSSGSSNENTPSRNGVGGLAMIHAASGSQP